MTEPLQPKAIHEVNRRMWNETAAVHARGYVQQLREEVQRPDFSTFDEVEKRIFGLIDLKDKAVIQLCCNNGRELLSIKKAGAGRCVGVDISDDFIAQGRELATLGGLDIEFMRTDVYELSADLDGQFDLVYITVGALIWLHDLKSFFGIAARLLKPGGQLFIYEMHPVLNMYDPQKGFLPQDSYFIKGPLLEGAGPDYMDGSQTVSSDCYWYPHKLADILGAVLRNGLLLTHFDEYGHDLAMIFHAFEDYDKKPPLSYSLLARKAA